MDRYAEVMLINARNRALATFFYLDAAKKQNVPQDIIAELETEYQRDLAAVAVWEKGGI